MKSKADFIKEQARIKREEEAKKRRSAKESKSSRKRARTETILKDVEVETTPTSEKTAPQVGEMEVQDPLASTAEFHETVVIQDSPKKISTPPTTDQQPIRPSVYINNTGPVLEKCSDKAVWLGLEVAHQLETHEDVRKVCEMSPNQRAGQAFGHIMEVVSSPILSSCRTHPLCLTLTSLLHGQAWMATVISDLNSTHEMLDQAKDNLKNSRAENTQLRSQVADLQTRNKNLEDKLKETRDLYVDVQQNGFIEIAKLEKEITNLNNQVEEEKARADNAEIEWFGKGQDDRVKEAKEVGLEYKKILVDPTNFPFESSSDDEPEKEPDHEGGDENQKQLVQLKFISSVILN